MEATEVAWGFGFDSDRHVRGVRGGRKRQKARKMGRRWAGSGLCGREDERRERGREAGLRPSSYFSSFGYFPFSRIKRRKKREEKMK